MSLHVQIAATSWQLEVLLFVLSERRFALSGAGVVLLEVASAPQALP